MSSNNPLNNRVMIDIAEQVFVIGFKNDVACLCPLDFNSFHHRFIKKNI